MLAKASLSMDQAQEALVDLYWSMFADLLAIPWYNVKFRYARMGCFKEKDVFLPLVHIPTPKEILLFKSCFGLVYDIIKMQCNFFSISVRNKCLC